MSGPYTDEELNTGDFERNEVTSRERSPYKVGVCMDFAGGTQIARDFYDGIQLAIDEAAERGDVEHPVELAIREVNGPMRGTSPVVLNAWRELAHEENCLVIIGPVVTEANLAIVEEVNRSKVPTISFCATFDWAGPYCYALQNGGFPDEAMVLAAYIARQGHERVGVFHEDGLIGDEFFAAFKSAAHADTASASSAITPSGSSTHCVPSSPSSLPFVPPVPRPSSCSPRTAPSLRSSAPSLRSRPSGTGIPPATRT